MIKALRLLLALSLTAMVAGCSKEEANPSYFEDEYRFFINGSLDGIPFEFRAGEEGRFLETGYHLEDSLVVMTSSLARVDEPNHNSLQLLLRGGQTLLDSSHFELSSNLHSGAYPLREPFGSYTSVQEKRLQITADSLLAAANYWWDLGQGSTQYNYPFSRTLSLDMDSLWPITLHVQDGACSSSITHYINAHNYCQPSFSVNFLGNAEVELSVNHVYQNVQSVQWWVNGNLLNGSASTGQLASLGTSGTQSVEALITLEGGCQKRVKREFPANATGSCLHDFRCSLQPLRVADPKMKGTVEVVYYNAAGKRFSSSYAGTQGSFKMNSLSDNGHNEKGQSTTRFFFDADLILRSDDGSSLPLSNVYGSLAVAHP